MTAAPIYSAGLIYSVKGFAVLPSEEPVAILEKLFLCQHSTTGCLAAAFFQALLDREVWAEPLVFTASWLGSAELLGAAGSG